MISFFFSFFFPLSLHIVCFLSAKLGIPWKVPKNFLVIKKRSVINIPVILPFYRNPSVERNTLHVVETESNNVWGNSRLKLNLLFDVPPFVFELCLERGMRLSVIRVALQMKIGRNNLEPLAHHLFWNVGVRNRNRVLLTSKRGCRTALHAAWIWIISDVRD